MDIQDQLPLTEATFFILISLAPEAKHGYAILKDVEALSAGRIVFGTGTLYGALKRLLDSGWIERVENGKENETGRLRKAYRLTRLGRRILEAETARLKALVRAASSRMAEGTR